MPRFIPGRSALPIGALLVTGLLAACNGSPATSPAPSSAASLPPATGPTIDVEMQDYVFAPSGIEIEVGTTVRWTNRGQAPHTATAGSTFDTGQLATGQSASHTFSAAGTFAYVCSLHPTMTGSVTVVEATSSGQPSAAPSASPTAAPTAEPSPTEATAEPSPSAPSDAIRIDVPLTIATSHAVTARVVDWTQRLTAATSGTPGDGASVPFDAVVLANDGPTTVVVTWAAGPCDSTPSVVLDGTTLTVVQEPCQGDAIAFDRIVRLEFSEPVDAASLTGVLQAGGDTPG